MFKRRLSLFKIVNISMTGKRQSVDVKKAFLSVLGYADRDGYLQVS
ncbi:hypothetical protein NIES2100_49240 [Calothrix sp. NIES-2100]|nr:hypothetical protein NIES2100_49240 [Calothrix sp. NIES-2100]